MVGNPAVSELNKKPQKHSRCPYCGNENKSVRAKPGDTAGHVDTDFMTLYYCTNTNCKNFGNLTVLYLFGETEPQINQL